MARIDLSPLYRSTVGFDHFASLLDSALSTEQTSPEYPPYNIEAMDEYHSCHYFGGCRFYRK